MHSSYTSRRRIEKLLCMINTLTAIQLSKNLCHLHSVTVARCVFTTSSPCTVNVHTPATHPKCLFSPSSPTMALPRLGSSLQSENYCSQAAHRYIRTPGSLSAGAIRTPLGVDQKILSNRKEPMLSGFLTLNAQSIFTLENINLDVLYMYCTGTNGVLRRHMLSGRCATEEFSTTYEAHRL